MSSGHAPAAPLGRRLGLPNAPWAYRLSRGALLLWLGTRLLLALLLSLAGDSPGAPLPWRAAALAILLPVLLTLLDLRVLREGVFYRNMGWRPLWLVLLPLAAAALPELLLDTLLHACCG